MPKPNVKEQIVTTSLSLLHGKGFNATSVQDITDAAGVPKGSFYNHFASKEALGVEVLQRYADGAAQLGCALNDTSLPVMARLQQYFDALVESNAANAYHCGCMLGNFSTELSNQSPVMRQAIQQSYAAWTERLGAVFAEGQRDGSIANTQPAAQLADFVVDAWQGAVMRSKAEKSREPLDRFVNMVLHRILT